MQEKFVTAGDRVLWSQSAGADDRDVILLVAGANASALMWPDAFVELLTSRGFRVIRYDHRDTGRSTFLEFEEAPYAVTQLAADAVSVLDGWGVERAHVVGLSLGATVGQLLALDYPQRLQSVTLMCGAALDVDFVGNIGRALSGEGSPDGLPLPKREVLEALAGRASAAATLEQELQRRVDEWRMLSGDRLEFDETDYRRREQRCIEHAGSWMQPENHAKATPVPVRRGRELRHVNVPALVIQGSEDPLNPPPHGQHIVELMGNAHLLELNGLGHCLPKLLLPRIAGAICQHARSTRHS